MKKKILIIGGSSLLSLNLVFFLRRKFSLHLACNSRKPRISSVESFFLNFNKISEIKKKINTINPNIILLSGALTNIEYCEKYKKKAYKINYLLNKKIVDIAKKYSIKIIFISTDQVYNGKKSFSKETEAPHLLNYYSKTKLLSENYIKKKINKYLILRTNFFGYGPIHRLSFSDQIINNYKKKIKVFYFKDVYFNPIYMPIFAKILNTLLNINAKGIFNICSPDKISKFYFAKKIFQKFKFNKKFLNSGYISSKKNLTKRPSDMSMSCKKVANYTKLTLPKIDKQIMQFRKDYKSKYYYFIKKIRTTYMK